MTLPKMCCAGNIGTVQFLLNSQFFFNILLCVNKKSIKCGAVCDIL